MLSFKYFTEQNLIENKLSNYDRDLDSELEGLADILNHTAHLGKKNIDPRLLKLINDNTNKNLISEDSEESPHKALSRKLAQQGIRPAVLKALKRHLHSYGQEIGRPLTHKETADVSAKAVEEHYKKTPEEQNAALALAARRIGHVLYNREDMKPSEVGEALSGGNKKTDTSINNRMVTHKGRLVNGVSSFGGSPGAYNHAHNSTGETVSEKKTCPHGGGGCMVGTPTVRPSCLAMSGAYAFGANQDRRGIIDHIRNGQTTAPDHAILVAHHLKTQAQKAAKAGKVHVFRGQTTDEQGHVITAIANALVRAHQEGKKSLVGYGYSKGTTQVLNAARNRKSGQGVPEYYVHSHPGPAIHRDESGKLHLNSENIRNIKALRMADDVADREGLSVGRYMVLGGKSPINSKAIHRQPKQSSSPEEKANFEKVDNSVRTVREWDLHHSGELSAGEKESAHDKKTGRGYTTIEQDGKRIKIGYRDRKANPGSTKSGHVSYSERHDGRFADGENDAGHAIVSAPVSSTANLPATGEHLNGLMHQAHVSLDMDGTKLRHSGAGIFHDAHPDLMKEAGYKYEPKQKIPAVQITRSK